VDFADTESRVQFESGVQPLTGRMPVHSTSNVEALQSFQGFDFEIVSLQPFQEPVDSVAWIPFP
jgi:hypothetical protein